MESSSDPMNPLLSNTKNSVVRWREWIEQLVSTNSSLQKLGDLNDQTILGLQFMKPFAFFFQRKGNDILAGKQFLNVPID